MPMRSMRFLIILLSACWQAGAPAQTVYPTRPVRIIVGYSAGGSIDVTARIIGDGMSRVLEQAFVIDNRPGAGGLIGQTAAAHAEPDGYTLSLVGTTGFVLAPRLLRDTPYTIRDFAAIGSVTAVPMVIEVNAASKFSSFPDFVAFAKSNPGKIRIGHAGNGTTNQIAIMRLQEALGVSFTIVPYKGSSPALTDLLGNSIDAVADQVPASLGYINAKTFRALAVTSITRAKDLPDVPTIDELGVKGFNIVTGSGIVAPAKTPAAVIDKLSHALSVALNDPDVSKRLRTLGAEVTVMTPAQYGELIRKEDAGAAGMIREGLFTVE